MSNEVTMNRQLGATKIKNAVLQCIKMKQPVMIWGPGGVGKSSIIKQMTKELDGRMYDVRLSQMEPTDIRGIPFYNKENGKMDWAAPIDLPDPEDAKNHPIVVLFLDELSSAVPTVAAAAYQLILDRKVGKYELPNNCVVVAAGNREADKGVVYRMPAPLANRLVHLEMNVDFDAWQAWAVNNQIHPDIIGYLSDNKHDIYDFDPKSPSKSFATPRSWEFVSNLITNDVDEETLTDLVAGTIGEGLALKFISLRKRLKNMPKPKDILAGTAKEMKEKEVSAMYALTMSCAYELKALSDKAKKAEFIAAGDNYIKYSMNNFTTEVVVMGMRIMLQDYDLPFDPNAMKSFDSFINKFGKLILRSSAIKNS